MLGAAAASREVFREGGFAVAIFAVLFRFISSPSGGEKRRIEPRISRISRKELQDPRPPPSAADSNLFAFDRAKQGGTSFAAHRNWRAVSGMSADAHPARTAILSFAERDLGLAFCSISVAMIGSGKTRE